MPPRRGQRSKRLLFGLVFFEDLPASEVCREDQFVENEGLNLDLINTFQTVKVIDITGELPKNVVGKILDIGKCFFIPLKFSIIVKGLYFHT